MSRSTSLVITTLALALGLAGCNDASTAAVASSAAAAGNAAPSAAEQGSAGTDATAPETARQASAAAAPSVPVQVGGEAELDPCMSARVSSNGPFGVLAGPDDAQPQLATLSAGQVVYVCDPGPTSWYAGIVWSEDETMDCGLSSPVAERAPYAGACRSGWISLAALEHMAG